MKTAIIKTLSALLLLMLFSTGVILAESREVVLVKALASYVDEKPNEHRMPSRPIQCTISEDGIFIQGYDASEILSYEVYNFDGNCLLMTDNSQEFISLVMAGASIEVRLITADYILRGVLY